MALKTLNIFWISLLVKVFRVFSYCVLILLCKASRLLAIETLANNNNFEALLKRFCDGSTDNQGKPEQRKERNPFDLHVLIEIYSNTRFNRKVSEWKKSKWSVGKMRPFPLAIFQHFLLICTLPFQYLQPYGK